MKDIIDSRARAIIRDKWCFGERMNRIGDPFEWVDGRQMNMLGQLEGTALVLQYLAMSGEIYETPEPIRPPDFEKDLATIRTALSSSFNAFVPFATAADIDFEDYIESTATVKAQDCGFIKTFLKDLPETPTQFDIGPGLGANALYSTLCLNSKYISGDANPHSLTAQRLFFRQVASAPGRFFDTIDAETLQISPQDIRANLHIPNKFDIAQVPTWNLDFLEPQSIDLVSATWVLNEVNPAGIAWLLYHSDRMLREGGYFYIRDSNKLKPLRHSLDYDKALQNLGYQLVEKLEIKNRIDMHGIPRAYRKIAPSTCSSFEAFFDLHYNRFAVTTHGGEFDQNIEPS